MIKLIASLRFIFFGFAAAVVALDALDEVYREAWGGHVYSFRYDGIGPVARNDTFQLVGKTRPFPFTEFFVNPVSERVGL